MSKVRVYEVARELGLDNGDLMKRFAALGIQVRNHMSALEVAEVDRLKRALEKDKAENTVETKVRAGVVRRRTVAQPTPVAPPVEAAPPEPEPPRRVEPVVRKAAPPPAVVAQAQPTPPPPPVAVVVEKEPVAEIAPPPPPPKPAPVVVEAAPPPPPPPIPTPAPPPPPVVEPVAEVPSARDFRPSQPPPASVRLAHSNLPPGVLSRGNQTAPSAAPPSMETRNKIVQNAQLQRPSYAPSGMPGARRVEVTRPGLGGPRPGGQGQPMNQGGPGGGKRPMFTKGMRPTASGSKSAKTQITTPSAQKRIIRIEENISLQQLAQKMSLKATEVLMKLMTLGMGGVNINSRLDSDTAKLLASEFGYEVENVAKSDDELVQEARSTLGTEVIAKSRPPIVTVMGHVDHGKTSLLDRIRKTNVASGEAGGITQHIGAYRVETAKGPVVFLDTPGHEAFTAMRARGAAATDIVVLVVAADDGVMPQTREAVAHAKAAKVPIIVAVNKIDKAGARPDQIRNELAGLGLNPEEWGGDTLYVNLSAMTGEGVDTLVENIALQTEVMELTAKAEGAAEGVVLEAYLDKGRGVVANVLVQNGTLNQGDLMLAGTGLGRIRALTDDRGRRVKVAGPATPVEVLGLPDLPSAGDQFFVVNDQKKAQELVETRKKQQVAREKTTVKRSLEDIQRMMKAGESQDLNLVIKSDMAGSVEALVKALTELSTDKVKVGVIHTGVGGITENDVMLASASKAIIVGFNVRPAGQAGQVAKSEGVEIRTYSIIYEAVDDVKKAMTGLLAPTFKQKELGRAEVRKVFNVPKIGVVLGCYVLDGTLKRNGKARLIRDSIQVWEGSIASLRRIKDDVKEVANGFECGVGLEGFNDVKEFDIIECYELEQTVSVL